MVKGVFTGSLKKAKEINAERYYWDSHKENVFCKNTIEWMLMHRFNGTTLYGDCAGELCDLFGIARVAWVLANTVQRRSLDRRIGKGNAEWANKFLIPDEDEDRTEEYCVMAHAELVGELVWQLRSDCIMCEVADYSECVMEEDYSDFSDKLVIISPGFLKDVYRTREYQYAYVASHDNVNSISESRMQSFQLMTNKQMTLRYDQILGVADEKMLPDEVAEKLKKYRDEFERLRGMQ